MANQYSFGEGAEGAARASAAAKAMSSGAATTGASFAVSGTGSGGKAGSKAVKNPDPAYAKTRDLTPAQYDTKVAQDVLAAGPMGQVQKDVTDEAGVTTTKIERPGQRDVALEEANRAKMLASGQLTAGANQTLAQQKVNLFTYGVEEPTWSAVDSSLPAEQKVTEQIKEVGGDMASTSAALAAQGLLPLPTPDYTKYKDYSSEISRSRAEAKTLYEDLKANTEEDFANRQMEQQIENRITTGSQSKQLARMGALGRSASAMGYMQSVQRNNQLKINELLTEKQSVLLQATNAYLAQDWTKLQGLINENTRVTDQLNDIQKWKLEDAIKTNDQVMEQSRFGWDSEDRALAKVTQLAESGLRIQDFSDEKYVAMANQMGVDPSDLEAIYTTIQDASMTKTEIERQTAIVDLRNKIPEGQSFVIGDNTYAGWKQDKPNISTNIVKNEKTGRTRMIIYNEDTGEVTERDLGYIQSGTPFYDDSGNVFYLDDDGNSTDVVKSIGKNDYTNPRLEAEFNNYWPTIGKIEQEFGVNGHSGIDISNKINSPITAMTAGTVSGIGYNSGYGNFIQVTDDASGKITQYSHLNAVEVTKGQPVTSGFQLGLMGNTGDVKTLHLKDGIEKWEEPTPEELIAGRGSHLHIETWYPKEGTGEGLSDKPTSQTEVEKKEDIKAISGQVDSIKGSDGYMDTDKYRQLREQVAKTAPTLLNWFDDTYAPKMVLNPKDPTAQKYFVNPVTSSANDDFEAFLNAPSE